MGNLCPIGRAASLAWRISSRRRGNLRDLVAVNCAAWAVLAVPVVFAFVGAVVTVEVAAVEVVPAVKVDS